MNAPYTPRTGSAAQRCITFLQLHPRQEHMELDEMIDRFEVTAKNVHNQLALCVENGLLVRDINSDGEPIYRRGPHFPVLGATPLPAPARPAVKRTYQTPPDLTKVTIDTDVPPPSRGTLGIDYTVLLTRLKPGHSAMLPLSCKGTLAKAISAEHKAGKARYTQRTIDDDNLRVWRTE